MWFPWSCRSTQTSYTRFRPQTGHWHDGTKCSEMMIYLARWNKKTNKQNGRLLSFLFTFDPDTWQTNTVIFSEFNWKIVFSKITSRISKPLSVFDKLGFASWLILGDEFLFLNLFFIFRFFFVILCYLLIINFYKNFCYYYHFINFFFMKIYFIFSCSGMFRNVPCSGFYRFIVIFVRLKRQTS